MMSNSLAICEYTYRSGDEEAREQVPEANEEGHDDCRNLVIWGEGNSHHTIQRKIDEAH